MKLSAKDEDLLQDLTIAVRGKLARAATSSSVSVQQFSQVFLERLVADVALALDLELDALHEGIDGEQARLRGDLEESDG